jgi:poly(3-hydroxybutyrate) depolymerase
VAISTHLRCLVVFAFLISAWPAAAAQPLPEMHLDPAGTTVSGLSSGAFMAVQLHVAFSTHIAGAGVVAGGPYFCAEGLLSEALYRCMQTTIGPPRVDALVIDARALAAAGEIDPLEGLAGDRVYLFSGTADDTVTAPVVAAARDFYLAVGVAPEDIAYEHDVAAGHAFLVEDAENPCAASRSPFINDCDMDQAGIILAQLYGTLAPPGEADDSRLLTFDQTKFLADPEAHGMARSGFVYIPAACQEGAPCRLHIALAGCRQTPDDIGDRFARGAGFNRWAETNRLVILYPQSHVSPGNPNGCWDWWGYDDPAYHTRRGRQMAAIAAMAARLGVALAGDAPAPVCRRFDDWNWNHWITGRATWCGWLTLCATGSGELLGFAYAPSTVYESPAGVYSTTPCAP